MKQLFSIITIGVVLSLGLGACIKNDDVVWTGSQVEIEATSWNANAAGLTYPIIPRIPGYGRVASPTADSTLRRQSRTISIRINLIGAQLSTTKAETVGYE